MINRKYCQKSNIYVTQKKTYFQQIREKLTNQTFNINFCTMFADI